MCFFGLFFFFFLFQNAGSRLCFSVCLFVCLSTNKQRSQKMTMLSAEAQKFSKVTGANLCCLRHDRSSSTGTEVCFHANIIKFLIAWRMLGSLSLLSVFFFVCLFACLLACFCVKEPLLRMCSLDGVRVPCSYSFARWYCTQFRFVLLCPLLNAWRLSGAVTSLGLFILLACVCFNRLDNIFTVCKLWMVYLSVLCEHVRARLCVCVRACVCLRVCVWERTGYLIIVQKIVVTYRSNCMLCMVCKRLLVFLGLC